MIGNIEELERRIAKLEKRKCCCTVGDSSGVVSYNDGDSVSTVAMSSLVCHKIGITFDGGGAELVAGYGERDHIPCNYVITGYLIAEHSETPITGSAEITVATMDFDDYDTTPVFTTILTAELDTGVKNEVTGLNIPLTAGTIVQYTLTSATTVEIIHLTLILKKV
jgi:hypothetical protein